MEKAILGKWEADEEPSKNKDFEAYFTAMELDEKMKEIYSKMRETLEYIQEGDSITCNVIMDGKVVKTYKGLQQGKEMEIDGMDGKPCKYCYRIENGIWVEKFKPGDGKGVVVETTKVVNGNKMTITHTAVGKGVSYSYTSTKQ